MVTAGLQKLAPSQTQETLHQTPERRIYKEDPKDQSSHESNASMITVQKRESLEIQTEEDKKLTKVETFKEIVDVDIQIDKIDEEKSENEQDEDQQE